MAIEVKINNVSIQYPQIGDTEWGNNATNFAIQTATAFNAIGLSNGTTVDLPGTLDVTGNTTLDANLSVGGTTSLTGNVTLTNNLTVNGNTQLGNANTDTIGVTGIVNVDAGTLYVDPVNNRVGINKTTPAQALDVVGNIAVSGNETVGGTLGVTGDVAINTNKFNVTASSGNTTIAGTLGVTGDVSINTNKFNVTASSGNTSIAGTFTSTGLISSSTGVLQPTAIFEDKQSAGTAGPTITTGAWRTRRLNTSTYNNITGASLASNQITLPSGNYIFFGYCKSGENSSNAPVRSQLRLYNITDSSVIQSGINGFNNAGSGLMSTTDSIIGYFSIASTKVIELQQQSQLTMIGGVTINSTFSVTNEIYASIKIIKVG